MRSIVLNKTYAQMSTLISGGGLDSQTFYKITDRGDNGIVLQAATTNQLVSDGIRYMLCPATYSNGIDAYDNTWIGVWNSVKQASVTEGQLCIWNGLVWTAGAVLSGDSPSTEASGWVVIPKATFTNHEYIEMIFGVTYNFDDDWVNKQWDNKGNMFGINKTRHQETMAFNSENTIDYCDWNWHMMFYNNTCFFIYNNSNEGNVCDNFMPGVISGNSCGGEGSITNNSNNGDIINNSNNGIIINNSNNGDIEDNSNNGDITDNTNNGAIYENTSLSETTCSITKNINNGDIAGSWNADVTDTIVDKTGTAS